MYQLPKTNNKTQSQREYRSSTVLKNKQHFTNSYAYQYELQKSEKQLNQQQNYNPNNRGQNRMIQPIQTFQCEICGKNKQMSSLLNYCGCRGKFCEECTIQEIQRRINTLEDPACCCGKILIIQSGFLYDIPPQMYQRYLAMRFKKEISENNFKLCCNGCENGILAESTIKKKSVFACIMCEIVHCPKCLEKSHKSHCDNRILLEMITKQNYCFCTKCKKAVFKDGGCNFMRCACKYSFCDVCWGPYPDHGQPHICAPQAQQQKTKIIACLKQQQQLVTKQVPYWKYFYNKMSNCIRGQTGTSNICKQLFFFLCLISFFWIFLILYTIVIFLIYYGLRVIVCLAVKDYCNLLSSNCNDAQRQNLHSKCRRVLCFVFGVVFLILLFPIIFTFIYFFEVINLCCQKKNKKFIYYQDLVPQTKV